MTTQNKRVDPGRSTLSQTALAGGPMSNHAMEMTMNTHITLPTGSATLTMSSREIAELTHKRHDNVKRTIQALAADGAMQLPQIEEVTNHLGQTVTEFRLLERDTYVVVAKLSPKFMAAVVDEWMRLRSAHPELGGPADLGLIQLADSARVASETTRDLIIHQAGSTRGAVIKAVKDFAGNPIATLKRYLDDRFVALHQRDVHFHRAIGELLRQTSSVTALAERSASPTTFVAGEWADLDMVLHMAGHRFRMPRPKALNALLVKSLDDFCLESNRWGDSARSPFGRRCRIWRKPVVQAWLKDRGRALIDQHIARNSGSNVLQFAKTDGEGK